jgi:hypothetical protein
MLYLTDPKDGKPSVSLTIVLISLLFLLTCGILDLLGKVEGTSIALEFFIIACSLYFGRRMSLSKTEGLKIEGKSE